MKLTKYLIAATFAAALLTAGALAATPPNGAASYKGVDIYHGSNVLDFAALKASGHADFAWVKSSEGEHTKDPKFTDYAAGCKSTGIKWGPYHFLRLYSPESCRKQADAFWLYIKGTGYTVLPAVDVESHDGQQTSEGMRACVRAFVDEFQRVAGFKPVLYTYTSYANDYLRDQFTDCKLWLADYRGYVGDVQGWKAYDAWQYSGDKAHVAGIDNKTDLDVATENIFVNPEKSATVSANFFPGAKYFGPGKSNSYILTLDKALIRAGYSRYYKQGVNGASSKWGDGTRRACAAFQRTQGWKGSGADGIPGPETWKLLQKWM